MHDKTPTPDSVHPVLGWPQVWKACCRAGHFGGKKKSAAAELGIPYSTFKRVTRGDREPPPQYLENFNILRERASELELLPRSTLDPESALSRVPFESPAASPHPAESQLLETLTSGYLLARRPLFVLGAGVSAQQVPLLREMASYLAAQLNSATATQREKNNSSVSSSDSFTTCREMAERAQRISEGHSTREEAAEFFHFFQDSNDAPYPELWSQFSKALLINGFETSTARYEPLRKVHPTDAHCILGKLVVQRACYVVSLNFDRLTHRAIAAAAHDESAAVILSEPEHVRNYFSSPAKAPAGAVTKVRGDVFYAHCAAPECPLHHNPVPLHQLRESATQVTCPECGRSTLHLELSFPGLKEKETAALAVLEELLTFVGQRLSAVVFLGLSGRWDRYLLDCLFGLARLNDIPVADVRPAGDDEFLRGFAARYYPKVPIFRVERTADALLQSLQNHLSEAASDWRWAEPVEYEPRVEHSLTVGMSDRVDKRVWFKNTPKLAARLRDGSRISVDSMEVAHRLSVTQDLKRTLSDLAQLDLKNLWLASEPGEHNRYNHSLGAAAVGLLWYERLQAEDHRSPRMVLLDVPQEIERTLLANALLYHDLGHLPFSHLAEQVLQEINWQAPNPRLATSELQVFRQRIAAAESSSFIDPLTQVWLPRGVPGQRASTLCQRLLVDFVSGTFARPWLQCIVNSPLDADKIDYIVRDQEELTRGALPRVTRLPYRPDSEVKSPWLEDFLSDQAISPQGYICLHGRSALAAVELLRERLRQYRRLYLAPEMRVFERMAMEILKKFIIQMVMAADESSFQQEWTKIGLNSRSELLKTNGVYDLRETKGRLARLILESIHSEVVGDPLKEGKSLRSIWGQVRKSRFDEAYLQFLECIWDILDKYLKRPEDQEQLRWQEEASKYLVGRPIFIEERAVAKVREALRPLAHEFSCEVLLDVVSFPQRLGVGHLAYLPFGGRTGGKRRLSAGFLVPQGPAEAWTWKAEACCPLSESAVRGLGESGGMVLVIDPRGGGRPQSAYAFDRVRAECDRVENS